jgi:hypothetical protein
MAATTASEALPEACQLAVNRVPLKDNKSPKRQKCLKERVVKAFGGKYMQCIPLSTGTVKLLKRIGFGEVDELGCGR